MTNVDCVHTMHVLLKSLLLYTSCDGLGVRVKWSIVNSLFNTLKF